MNDLISRSALLEKMRRTSRYFDVKFDIEETPAVDAVEVPTGNVDDMERAIVGLGVFRLSFCLNVQETEAQGKPVFRCGGCPFENKKTRNCAVKMFLYENATEEQRHRFSPML